MYSLGATLLLLLSGKPPSELPQRGLRIDWEGAVEVGARLHNLLTALLQPEAEARADAKQALALLRGGVLAPVLAGSQAAPAALAVRRRPAGTRVVVLRDGTNLLSVEVPANGADASTLMQGSFATVWLGIVGMWTVTAVTAGAPLLFTAFSAPFWAAGVGMAKNTIDSALVSQMLRITPAEWSLASRAGKVQLATQAGATRDLEEVRVAPVTTVDGAAECVELVESARAARLGLGLTTAELEWVAAQVNAFLGDVEALGDDAAAGPRLLS
jgi:hypothetical protein